VKRFLLGFIKDEDEVLDMTQDIFYNIWTHRQSVSKVDSFKAYLFRMAKNAIYNHYKMNVIRQAHLQKFHQQQVLIDDLQEETLHAEELSLLIDIAVNNMPPQRKRIFTMSRKEGLTNDEIARQLNLNKRTVENHITQALADLRKVLKVILLFFI
jgi:RNA polymerase sigma-70 factor (ECF subfamily)